MDYAVAMTARFATPPPRASAQPLQVGYTVADTALLQRTQRRLLGDLCHDNLPDARMCDLPFGAVLVQQFASAYA